MHGQSRSKKAGLTSNMPVLGFPAGKIGSKTQILLFNQDSNYSHYRIKFSGFAYF